MAEIVGKAVDWGKNRLTDLFGGGDADRERAQAHQRAGISALTDRQGVELPGDVMFSQYRSPIALNGYESEMEYDPQLQGASAFDAMAGDAGRVQNSQDMTRATRGVFDIAQQGGLSAIDRARIAETRANENQWQKGQRGATLANMQARGIGGGGAELASMFDQQQAGANRNMMADTEMEGMAQQRQDSAWRDAFDMSNRQSTQSFDQDAQRATANDLISQNNAASTTAANLYNAGVRQKVRTHDVDGVNDTNNANTDITNRQSEFNNDQAWRGIDRGDQIAGSISNAHNGVATQQFGRADKQNDRFWQTAGTIVKAAAL